MNIKTCNFGSHDFVYPENKTYEEIALGFQSIPDESKPMVNTMVIYVENHQGTNR